MPENSQKLLPVLVINFGYVHYRPTGRKYRPLIPLSFFLKFGVAMSIGVHCLTHRAAENGRLLSKQIVF